MEGREIDEDQRRLHLILDREGLVRPNGKLRQKLLWDLSYEDPSTGRCVYVFHDGGSSAEIENTTRNNTRSDRANGLSDKTKKRVALWLSEAKKYIFRDDLFTRQTTSDKAFADYATTFVRQRHEPIVYRSKICEEIDTAGRVLKTMFEAHASHAFDKSHVAKYVIPATHALTQAVANSSSVRNYIDTVSAIFVLYKPCYGCGVGATGFQYLLPLVDIMFERKRDIMNAISVPDEKLAFAHVLERKLAWLRLQGKGQGEEASNVVESLVRVVFDELWDHKDKGAVLSLAKQSKSALQGSSAFEQLRDAVAEKFGEHSIDAVGFQRCIACKRISECADGKAKEFLDEAREVHTKALKHAMRNFEQNRIADLKEVRLNIDFLEVAWLEGQSGFDPDTLHSKLRTEFCDGTPEKLMALLRYYDSSLLRRARVHYWLWVYEEVKTPYHLLAAQRCIEQNQSVQELCVLNVPRFKKQLKNALNAFSLIHE